MNCFFRYMSGYLTIEISGDNSEYLLNKIYKNKVFIWNLHCKKGKIIGNISAKNFYKLRYLIRGTNNKIKILNKKGFNFYIKKYNKRAGIVVGIIIFTAILSILTNYIWIINVDGNVNLSKNEIINSCRKLGIYEGVLKRKVNSKYDAQRLQLLQKEIAWCSLNIEGSVLTVNLSEAAVSDKEERVNPTNLKAVTDGKIKKINVTTGNVLIKTNDTVIKGQLLVSGIKENNSSTVFVHSSGEIIAETKRIFSAEGKFIQTKNEYTNKTINRKTIKFFNIKLPLYLGNVKEENQHNITVKHLSFSGKKIPIKVSSEHYDILKKRTVKYNEETLIKLLNENIKEQIKKFNFISIKENDRQLIKTQQGILLKIEYFCEEDIAVQDNILLNTEN